MDFEYAPEHEAFRKEFRGWLAASLPPELCLDDAADDRVASDRETFERRRAWQKTMHGAGWVGINWPKEYGGRAATLIERVIWDEEYTAARAPVLPGNMGLNLIGPTIIHWGTDAQRHRHLPSILSGDEVWCQGFSEPGAGSDLASLATRAVDRGDHFVVNGQKVWTSGAQYAHWIFLLARTDPSVPKHQGISAFLVPMNSPGITVRPLVLMTGHPHFNEVFFSDVVVPKSQLLGPLNHGWKVSTTTLMYERHSTGARNPIGQVRDLIAVARRLHADGGAAWDDARIRQRLAQLVIDCHAMRYTRYRNLTRQLRGDAPGPEGSVLKLSGSELGVRIADAAGELLGMHALINRGTELVPDAPRWFNRLIAARQYTISAGTSEIQRNIIGERVLGLPKG
jgi:alkylation response protein AidB-like acyl-CoA dehydrogenase